MYGWVGFKLKYDEFAIVTKKINRKCQMELSVFAETLSEERQAELQSVPYSSYR